MRSLQEIYLHILEDKMPSLHLWSDLTAINTKNYYMWQYSAKFCPTIQVILPFATLWQYYLAGWQSSAHHTRYSAVLGYRLSIPMRSLGWAPYKWNVLWEWVPFSFHSISLSLILALSVTLVSCPNGQLFPKPSSLCTSFARTSRTSIRQRGKPLF